MGSAYLVAYNGVVFCGWAYCLYLVIQTIYINKGSTQDLWKVVELPLKVAQTAAVMEVLHSLLGVVRSPVAITGMQVASRLWIVWGIIHPLPKETTSGSVAFAEVGGYSLHLNLTTLLLAWSITEVIRYAFFAAKELGGVPYVLQWLRYTSFIPLYPLGVASELSMVKLAYPTIAQSHMWSIDLPNRFNFAFDYAIVCLLVVVAYIPGLPQLYLYMLAQRKKVLGGSSSKRAKAE